MHGIAEYVNVAGVSLLEASSNGDPPRHFMVAELTPSLPRAVYYGCPVFTPLCAESGHDLLSCSSAKTSDIFSTVVSLCLTDCPRLIWFEGLFGGVKTQSATCMLLIQANCRYLKATCVSW